MGKPVRSPSLISRCLSFSVSGQRSLQRYLKTNCSSSIVQNTHTHIREIFSPGTQRRYFLWEFLFPQVFRYIPCKTQESKNKSVCFPTFLKPALICILFIRPFGVFSQNVCVRKIMFLSTTYGLTKSYGFRSSCVAALG